MITIINKPCGYGKTTSAIEQMTSMYAEGKKFIYVTPFLDEITRVTQCVRCPLLNTEVIKTPSKSYSGNADKPLNTKSEDFIYLLQNRQCIATTHQLFLGFNKENIHLLNGYHLILDEVINPIEPIDISKDELHLLHEGKLIQVAEDGNVAWTAPNFHSPLLNHIKKKILTGSTYLVNDSFLMWMFPKEIFSAFESAQVLTYMFHGTILRAYFAFHNIRYSSEGISTEEHRNYRRNARRLVTSIVEDSKNFKIKKVRKGHKPIMDSAFSVNHCKTLVKEKELAKISTRISNFLRNRDDKDKLMFTVYNDFLTKASWAGLKKAHIPLNERATNKYADRTLLVYVANRYLPPHINALLGTKNLKFNEDLWATNELIQWIYRSAIRNNEPITVYIPSYRMRTLLKNWLNAIDLEEPDFGEDVPWAA